MTDLQADELAAKILLMLDRMFQLLDLDVSILDELSTDEKVRIFADAMSASGLSLLSYIMAPSEKGIDNG